MPELPKHYKPEETEDKIYALWEQSGFFNPDTLVEKGLTKADASPYCIVLPPPNVTGTLHIGHAVMLAVQDALVRYRRLRGDRALWVPGTDHAAIATQAKVEKELYEKEGKTRHDLGRAEFLKRVEAFAQESHDTIVKQIRKMGASVDWSREAYTLDEKRSHAVRTAFKNMYDDGLIYRGVRIVNWDPKLQTTVSDDEVEHVETKGALYTFRYAKDFPIPIATTRPETKLGDVAVAVHPDDKRYAQYVGKEYDITFVGTPLHITVVADEEVDPAFGTGAVGVTPAHSTADNEIAQRHDLPSVQVIDEDGKMTVEGPLKGLPTLEARTWIIEQLKEQKLFEKEEEIDQNLSVNSRGGGVIEPLPKLQWWVDVNKEFTPKHSEIEGIALGSKTTLKKIMRQAVKSGQIKILPERFEKTYFHWIDNLRDWNISRQLWYGHRVPVWHHGEKMHVGIEEPEGEDWKQDPDTLDTWFSSGLWTFSTLGWPEKTHDLATYHPTDVLETAYDILFFWVARMILMSSYHMGQIPFRTVYLHGLVRDEQGRKMSKSLDNIIDPLDLIAQYGADATRLSLLVGAPPGADSRLSEDNIRGYKHFANKIWNITRFVLMNADDFDPDEKPNFSEDDKRILAEFKEAAQEITRDIDEFRLYLAAEKAYHYLWHTFADKVLEESKSVLQDKEHREARQHVLLSVLKDALILLHPFVPFVTEELYQHLPNKERKLLMVERWPVSPPPPAGRQGNPT